MRVLIRLTAPFVELDGVCKGYIFAGSLFNTCLGVARNKGNGVNASGTQAIIF